MYEYNIEVELAEGGTLQMKIWREEDDGECLDISGWQ
jgi:hypothetical protein